MVTDCLLPAVVVDALILITVCVVIVSWINRH